MKISFKNFFQSGLSLRGTKQSIMESRHGFKVLKIVAFVILILVLAAGFVALLPKNSVRADNQIATVGGSTPTILNTGGKLYFNSDIYHSNLTIDNYTGDFTGYVWSDDLGWIDFGSDSGNDLGPVTVSADGAVTGKAKVINDGTYLDFNSSPTGANVAIANPGGVFSGYAWSTDLGWIDFNGVAAPSYSRDQAPPTNATSVTATMAGSAITTDTWHNGTNLTFVWPTAETVGGAVDTTLPGGIISGVAGYYVYFGTDPTANPKNTSGVIGTASAPVYQTGATITFDKTLVTNSTYYLVVTAVDNAGNVTITGITPLFTYKYDNVKPNSPTYISASPSGYTRTNHFTFLWPTTGVDMATDTGGSGLAYYQYKVNDGVWSEYTTESTVTLDNVATSGINIFYLQTLDNAGNTDAKPRSIPFYFNAAAPTAPTNLTATPASSLTNSFAFSWDEPSSFNGSIAGYFYVINPINGIPTTTNVSYTTDKSLPAGPYATAQGPNTIYVVAKDEAGNFNLSSCVGGAIIGNTDSDGCASLSFTANTAAPGIPTGVAAVDGSNRDAKEYKVFISWNAPTDLGAGFAGYEVFRSTDGKIYTSIGTTSGTTYADTELQSKPYYYYVRSKDNANQFSANSSIVSLTPTGKYTQAPTLTDGPMVDNKAFSATVTWQTSREASSFVYYSTTSGGVSTSKAMGTPDKLAKHSVVLIGLQPETTYYYRVMWEDVDGNQGLSNNFSFRTALRPKLLSVTTADITLDSATVSWKSTTIANSVLNFGKTSAYGGAISETSGTQTTNHLIRLTKLEDGTVYHFQIMATDMDGNKIVSDDYSFQTLIRPIVSQFGFEPVLDAATTTLKFGWKTNVPTTSIVTYQAPGSGSKSQSKAELDTNHEIIVSDLLDKSSYSLQARSVDAYGNTAVSDLVTYTTPIDSRPPKVLNLTVEVKSVGFGAAQSAQLVVSWETDEAGSSQIEYGPGISSTEYATKTKEDGAMTTTHVVIASGLDPSKIYHLRAVSADASGNIGSSDDTTVITGKVQNSVLDIIMNSLQGSLGWFFTIFK